MCLESIIGITAKRHDNLKKLLVFFILIITSCNAIFAQFKSSDIIKASDMVLDLNSFKEAHMVLTVCGLPINFDASDEFARLSSKSNDEYRKYLATNLFIYWPQYQINPKDLFLGRLSTYGPSENDIKELFFTLGESFGATFVNSLTNFGYKKIKTEMKKDKERSVNYQETTFQKSNHLCIIRDFKKSTFHVFFKRKERQESEEDKMISEQCIRFARLHAVDGAIPYELKDMNVPYEKPADIEIQFPAENSIINIPNDVLCEDPNPLNKKVELTISSRGGKSIDEYDKKVNAYFNWINPYIKVNSVARVNFPRYGKGFAIGDSYDLRLSESVEEYDSCTVTFKVKCSGYTWANYQFTIKNQKDVESKLSSVYGNSDMLLSIWESFPKNKMFDLTNNGKTYMISVHMYKRKISYTLGNKTATYMLPFIYDWKEPVIKK